MIRWRLRELYGGLLDVGQFLAWQLLYGLIVTGACCCGVLAECVPLRDELPPLRWRRLNEARDAARGIREIEAFLAVHTAQ